MLYNSLANGAKISKVLNRPVLQIVRTFKSYRKPWGEVFPLFVVLMRLTETQTIFSVSGPSPVNANA